MILMSEEHIDSKEALKGCSGDVYKVRDYSSKRERYSDVYRQLREVKISELKDIS